MRVKPGGWYGYDFFAHFPTGPLKSSPDFHGEHPGVRIALFVPNLSLSRWEVLQQRP